MDLDLKETACQRSREGSGACQLPLFLGDFAPLFPWLWGLKGVKGEGAGYQNRPSAVPGGGEKRHKIPKHCPWAMSEEHEVLWVIVGGLNSESSGQGLECTQACPADTPLPGKKQFPGTHMSTSSSP